MEKLRIQSITYILECPCPRQKKKDPICVFSCFLASKFTVCSPLEAGHLSPWLLMQTGCGEPRTAHRGVSGLWRREEDASPEGHSTTAPPISQGGAGFRQSGAGSHSRDGGRRYPRWVEACPNLAQISCYPPRAQQRGSELHSAGSPGPHSLSRRLLVPWLRTTIVWGFFPNCHLKNATLSL